MKIAEALTVMIKIHHRTPQIKAAVIKQLEGLLEKKPPVSVFMWHMSKTARETCYSYTCMIMCLFLRLKQEESTWKQEKQLQYGDKLCVKAVKLVRKSHVRFNWDTRRGKTAL